MGAIHSVVSRGVHSGLESLGGTVMSLQSDFDVIGAQYCLDCLEGCNVLASFEIVHRDSDEYSMSMMRSMRFSASSIYIP